MTKQRDTLEECRTRGEFRKYALAHGGNLRRGGNHNDVVSGPVSGRPVPLPGHTDNEQYQPGMRRSIVSQLRAIGIVTFLFLGCGTAYAITQSIEHVVVAFVK